MNIFSKIKWNAETNDENDPCFILNNGHKYYIRSDGEHFDIYCEYKLGNKYYFEIKSTNKENKSAGISREQKKLGKKIGKNENYIIAVVSIVLTEPKIDYILFFGGHRYPIKINSEDPNSNLINSIDDIKKNWNENENGISKQL